MKRKLSLLMAFMMAATLLPAQPVFAASSNSINKTISALSNDKLGASTTGVILKITNAGEREGAREDEYFELHLSNGPKWNLEQNEEYNEGNPKVSGLKGATITKLSDSVLGVKVKRDHAATDKEYPAYKEVQIPMVVDLNGAPEGPQEVSVVPKQSSVSASKHVYATIGASEVKFRVEKKEKISRTGENKVTLILDEVTRDAFSKMGKNGSVVLRLPQGFSWKKETKISKGGTAKIQDDARNLTVTATDDMSLLQSLYIEAYIAADRSARTGTDVDVTVRNGDVTPSSLVIAEYVSDTVDVKVEKVLDVIAGKDVEGLYKAKVTLEENVANALLKGRYIEFTMENASLQDGERMRVRKLAGTGNNVSNILETDLDSTDAFYGGGTTNKEYIEIGTSRVSDDVDGSSWDLYVKDSSKIKAKYQLEIPFVVKSDFVGDLMLNVKGAGISGDAKNGGIDVKIATVKAPVTIEAVKPLPQVKIGLQKQKATDIIIKEVEAGALQDYLPARTSNMREGVTYRYIRVRNGNGQYKYEGDKYVERPAGDNGNKEDGYNYDRIIEHKEKVDSGNKKGSVNSFAPYFIKTNKKDFALSFDKADVKVEDGTLTLNADETDRVSQIKGGLKNAIKIAVDRKSTKASTIKISNVEATLDRTVPYGEVKLVADFGVVDYRHKLTNKTTEFEYFTTVTPVKQDKRITTVFKIGDKAYTEIIGKVKEEKVSDVAPFIKDNRTMLPVRYVANAIGATVNYDPTTRTATFQKDQTVVSINIDKDTMYVSGSPVKLFTKPANVEGRIFLPLANVAQAFGLKQGETLIWSQEAKTVTILPQDATAEEIKTAQDGTVLTNATEVKAEEKKEETKPAEAPKAEEKPAEKPAETPTK